MKNFLAVVTAAALSLAAAVSAQDKPVLQEVPAVRMSLTGPAIVSAKADVTLRLLVEVSRDTEVAATMLNGMDLTVRVGGKPANPISQPGKGGAVPLVKGTRIERQLTFPVSAFMANPDLQEMAVVAVGWKDQVGVDCTFKVAPDSSNVKVEQLDLAKTQVILVTNYGEMQLAFRPDKAPRHVENFVKLCLQGFYDGTKFHRVIRNFMIQGGCPNTKDETKRAQWGSGGPGYRIDAEFNDLRHLKGTLSMARTSDPNSAGSGFFIVHKDSPHLDNQYSAFGNLVEGTDVLDAIANVAVGGPQRSTPQQPVVLEAAVVLPVKKK
ncbi:MAG: peptidylprolyl isomerase [Planctomycetota bacterium]